jgi:hypothetical protein
VTRLLRSAGEGVLYVSHIVLWGLAGRKLGNLTSHQRQGREHRSYFQHNTICSSSTLACSKRLWRLTSTATACRLDGHLQPSTRCSPQCSTAPGNVPHQHQTYLWVPPRTQAPGACWPAF